MTSIVLSVRNGLFVLVSVVSLYGICLDACVANEFKIQIVGHAGGGTDFAKTDAESQCNSFALQGYTVLSSNITSCGQDIGGSHCNLVCDVEYTAYTANQKSLARVAEANCTKTISAQLAKTRSAQTRFEAVCSSNHSDWTRDAQCAGVHLERGIAKRYEQISLDESNKNQDEIMVACSPISMAELNEYAAPTVDEIQRSRDSALSKLQSLERYYLDRLPDSSIPGRDWVESASALAKPFFANTEDHENSERASAVAAH